MSLCEYRSEYNMFTMQATVACKLAQLYDVTEHHQQAANTYRVAAAAYKEIGDLEQQAICLYYQAKSFIMNKNYDEAESISDRCMVL